MDGIINVYKPSGMSSFDVVRSVRKTAGVKKVGHTGTLDPLAFGVLPICIGKATKIVDYVMQNFKIYKTVLKLGVVTDTYDMEGKVLSESEINVSEDDIVKAINSFTGTINQIPPMYSALKVNGKKLYDLARQGIEVERKSREITIYEIDIEKIDIPYVTFTVRCSKGTYIRSLCFDIGEKLKCGGVMYSLERTASGMFTKDNSVPLESITKDNLEKYLIPIDEALHIYDKIYVDNKFEKLLVNGVVIRDKAILDKIPEEVMLRTYMESGKFIGIGIKTKDSFKIVKLLLT